MSLFISNLRVCSFFILLSCLLILTACPSGGGEVEPMLNNELQINLPEMDKSLSGKVGEIVNLKIPVGIDEFNRRIIPEVVSRRGLVEVINPTRFGDEETHIKFVRAGNDEVEITWVSPNNSKILNLENVESQINYRGRSFSITVEVEIISAAQLFSIPELKQPVDKTIAQNLKTNLVWTGDSDITYTVLLDTQDPPATEIINNTQKTNLEITNLLFDTTYYWQVIAHSGAGLSKSSTIWRFKTLTNQKPTKPILQKPTAKSELASLKPQFSWSSSTDPEEHPLTYTLLLRQADPNFSLPADTFRTQISANSFKINRFLEPKTKYYWQVKAVDGYNAERASAIFSFTTRANQPPSKPKALTPADDGENLSLKPTFTWAASTDPDKHPVSYDLYIRKDAADFELEDTVITGLAATSYTLTGKMLAPASIYYWHVKAKDEYGGLSASAIFKFETIDTSGNEPPTPPLDLLPSGSGVTVRPTLTWTASSDPDDKSDSLRYMIYLDRDPNPTTLLVDNLRDSEYKLHSELDFKQTYYWRVVAFDGKGGIAKTAVQSFTTKANSSPSIPILISPSSLEEKVAKNSELVWHKSIDPDAQTLKYEIFLDENPKPTTKVTTTSDTTYTPLNQRANTTYYWQVRVSDILEASSLSAVYTYTTSDQELILPTALKPSPNQTNVQLKPTLTWTKSSMPDDDVSALKYRIYLGESPNPTALLIDNLTTNSYTFSTSLDLNKTYHWTVEAFNSQGKKVRTKSQTFTTKTNSPPSKPILLSPSNTQIDVLQNTKLVWQSSTDPDGQAVKYEVYLTKNGAPTTKLTPTPISDTTFTLTDQEDKQAYYWKVVAIDELGAKTSSPIFSYAIRSPLYFKVNIIPPSNRVKENAIDLDVPINQVRVAEIAAKAAEFWQNVIQGYHPDIIAADVANQLNDIFEIDLEYSLILAFPTLAESVPKEVRLRAPPNSSLVPNIISKGGIIRVNAYFTNSADLEIILRHEIGHALGFGILFENPENTSIIPPLSAYSLLNAAKNYTGFNGLSAYRLEFLGQGKVTFIPLTKNDDGGHLIEDPLIERADGKSLKDALMSPDVAGAGVLTETTKGILKDLGFILK